MQTSATCTATPPGTKAKEKAKTKERQKETQKEKAKNKGSTLVDGDRLRHRMRHEKVTLVESRRRGKPNKINTDNGNKTSNGSKDTVGFVASMVILVDTVQEADIPFMLWNIRRIT